MAIDKAVDSSVLDAGLTKIADAIREKAGTSDTMEFPDGFAELVAGIEAGGEWNVAAGSVVLAENQTLSTTEPWAIAHGLASKPLFALVYVDRTISGIDIFAMAAYGKSYEGISRSDSGLSYSASASGVNMAANTRPYAARHLTDSGSRGCDCDENNIYVYGTSKVSAGFRYFWVAGVKA